MDMTVKQAAEKWGQSDRRVRILCAEGKISGAFQEGRGWKIPKACWWTFSFNRASAGYINERLDMYLAIYQMLCFSFNAHHLGPIWKRSTRTNSGHFSAVPHHFSLKYGQYSCEKRLSHRNNLSLLGTFPVFRYALDSDKCTIADWMWHTPIDNNPIVIIRKSYADPPIEIDIKAFSTMQTVVKCTVVKNNVGGDRHTELVFPS